MAPDTGPLEHPLSLVWFILIGIAAGWLASQIMNTKRSGTFPTLVLGVIGSLVGGFVFSLLGLTSAGLMGDLTMATIGAVIFVMVARKLTF